MRIPFSSLLLLTMLPAGAALAQPMDLRDPQPRWVLVSFEDSPGEEPGRLDTSYGPPLRAWLDPDPATGRARLTVSGDQIERQLLDGHGPKPGSFSDFVWEFDMRTGHVVSARLSGKLLRALDWGLFQSTVETQVDVVMDTQRRGGFEGPQRMLGQTLFQYCAGEDRRCNPVQPVPYDFATGYVNAVGELTARSTGLLVRTFSPLGEAVFSELAELPDVAAR